MDKNEDNGEWSDVGRDWETWKRVILVGALGVWAIIFFVMMIGGMLWLLGYR